MLQLRLLAMDPDSHNHGSNISKDHDRPQEAAPSNPLSPVSLPSRPGTSRLESNGSSWRPLHSDLREKLKLEKLLDALRTRKRSHLEKAIAESQKSPAVTKNNEILTRAEEELQVAITKENLKMARASKNPMAIRDAVRTIPINELYMSRLQHDISEASSDLARLEQVIQLRKGILNLDMKTMSELRRYHTPTPRIHKVMQAVMLLLGEDEENTASWKFIQFLMNPHGSKGMNRRVLNLDPGSVNSAISARAKQILSRHRLEDIHVLSPGVATFYVWARGIIELIEQQHGPAVEPADIYEQKVIFGRLPALPMSPRCRRRPTLLPITARPSWK